jgi:hypothetical protein
MKVGDWVMTPDRLPSGIGTIEHVSDCGRYARVRKRYGKKPRVKSYTVKELASLNKKPSHTEDTEAQRI